jgi:hypothetical protein
MQQTELQVVLYNGEPPIRVTKMIDGYYQWATKKHAMFDHSVLSEVKNFMDKYGYKWFIVNQTREEYFEDKQIALNYL